MNSKIKNSIVVSSTILLFAGCNSVQPQPQKVKQQEVVNYDKPIIKQLQIVEPKIEIKKSYFKNGKVSFETKFKDGIEIEKVGFTYSWICVFLTEHLQ